MEEDREVTERRKSQRADKRSRENLANKTPQKEDKEKERKKRIILVEKRMTPSPMTTRNVKGNFFKGKTEGEMGGRGTEKDREEERDSGSKEEEKRWHTVVAMLHDLWKRKASWGERWNIRKDSGRNK